MRISKFTLPLLLLSTLAFAQSALADNLPEQRADFSYAFSNAGGDQVSGPEFSISKHLNRVFSLTGRYEADQVRAPDVDLAAPRARRLDETRQLGNFSLDYRDDSTRYSVGTSRTSGTSYETSLVRASITQGLFHDLTSLTGGASKSWSSSYLVLSDTGARDPNVRRRIDQRSWWVSVDQIVTPNLRVTYDGGMVDQYGELANPDIGTRYLQGNGIVTVGEEVTPHSRSRYNSSLHAKYFMGERGTLTLGGSYYYDSWSIRARSYDIGWVRKFRQDRLAVDVHGRWYGQGRAKFYSDLVSHVPTGEISRDRSLARHSSITLGTGLTWQVPWHPHFGIQHWTTGLNLDLIHDQYDDFRDTRVSNALAGTEPLYRVNGFLAQVHVTGWF